MRKGHAMWKASDMMIYSGTGTNINSMMYILFIRGEGVKMMIWKGWGG